MQINNTAIVAVPNNTSTKLPANHIYLGKLQSRIAILLEQIGLGLAEKLIGEV